MDVASERAPPGSRRAVEVEECNCPPGYEGLSCETCTAGYTRAPGVYLGICTRCDCNGHSDDCDSDRGVCYNCQHGTTGRFCENCAPGYVRNARDDSPYECLNPQTLASIPEPEIRVTIGGRAELVCRPFDPELPTDVIIWTRADGQPLPRASSQSQGTLVISNVQQSYSGDYVCTVRTPAGISGTSIATLIVIRSNDLCPRGYENPPSCNVCAAGFRRQSDGRCAEERETQRPPVASLVVTVSPSSTSVNEGDPIQLRCTARSQVDNSVYNVAWTKEGSRLPSSAVERDGELYIRSAMPSDGGTYICTGSNQFERKSEPVNVRVVPARPTRPPPGPEMTVTIEPQRKLIAPGRSGSIQCKVVGDARSVEWRRSRGDIASKNQISTTDVRDDTLTFVNMDVADRGYYYCTAVGNDAVTRVPVNTPALVDFQRSFVQIVNPDVRSQEGDTIRLECRADNTVRAGSITWTRDGVQPEIRDSRFTQSRGVLELRDARPSDSGVYVCTIIATSGQSQTSDATVNIVADQRAPLPEAPEVSITSGSGRVEVTEGEDLRLSCRLVGGDRDSRIAWALNGDTRSPFPANVETSGGSLYIVRSTRDNAGVYVCIGSNQAGTDRESVEVVVRARGGESPIIIGNLPDKVDAPLNQRVELTCMVPFGPGNIQPMVYWRNSRGQRLTEATRINATLVIDPVQMIHAGNYTCVAEIPGASSSKTLTLNVLPDVGGPFAWPENPKLVRAQIGDDVDIECQPSTSLPTATDWEREDTDMPITATQRGSRLVFRRLRLTDAGTYTCNAKNSLGEAKLYVNLVIQGAPRRPVVSANGETMSPYGVKVYSSGDEVTLMCMAEGSPTPQYKWFRTLPEGGFQELTTGGNIQIDDGTLSGQGTELIISNVRTADAGYYNCTATNQFGSNAENVRLAVRPASGSDIAPTNTGITGSGDGTSRNLYKTGETAILRCYGSSATPVSYRWTFSNGPLPDNALPISGVLRINNMSPDNQGTYYCVVTNTAGSSRPTAHQVFVSGGSTDIIRSPPPPTPSNTDYQATQGGIIRLQCPLPEGADRIEWSRENSEPLPVSARLSSRNQILELFDIQPRDGGVYYCYARNSQGSSPLVRLIVEIETVDRARFPDRPIVAVGSPTTQSVRAGGNVELSCIAQETDSSTIWTRDNQQRLPSNSRPLTDSLEILNIRPEDSGEYMCRARNQYGQSDPLIHTIIVEDGRPALPPTQVSPPEITAADTAGIGKTVDLRCRSDSGDRYTWEKVGGSLPENSAVSGGYLRIYDFKPEDAGVYTCTVEGASGTTATASHAMRADSPQLSLVLNAEGVRPDPSRPYEFAEGSALTLTCKPYLQNKFTDAEVRWERPGDSLPSHAYQTGSSLVFRRLEEIDRGSYRCDAVPRQAVYGVYSFDVVNTAAGPSGGDAVRSVEIVSSPQGDLRQGEYVTLQCVADGDGVFYEWGRYNNEAMSDSVEIRDSYLIIRDFSFEDEGQYNCTASNIYGPTQSATTMLQLG